MHSGLETEICEESSTIRCHKQYARSSDIWTNQMLGILFLRSLGYYKIKQGVLQQNLSKCYHFESAEILCEEFNTLVNKLKKDDKTVDKEKYPWLEDSDERKYMMTERY